MLKDDKHSAHKEHLPTVKAICFPFNWVKLINCYSNNNVKSQPQNYFFN